MEIDYFLVGFKKYYSIILLLIFINCKNRNDNTAVDNNTSIEVTDGRQCQPIENSNLDYELKKFITKNPLLDAKGNTYILTILKENNDTLINIERSFKPVLVDSTLVSLGAVYYNEKPLIIVDKKKPIGYSLYNINCLDASLYEELKKVKHPTSLYKSYVSSNFKLVNNRLEKMKVD